ncbi:MAG: histone deacetylase [Candidatus Eisenbacteria bacterium]|nr:histone deacetylase [Candidatus Eisenbacteria bacterium]
MTKRRIKIVYSDAYEVDIGPHVFATQKYRLIKSLLIEEKVASEGDFVSPEPATDDDVLLVHTKGYVEKLKNGTLSTKDILVLELPYSKELVSASWLGAGGTILSFKNAIEHGVGIHLGGGFHHAFPDDGEGFCVLNDIAIGIKRLLKDGDIRRAIVVDCDLHQGNGTAYIFREAPNVFTFSIHQEDNYPMMKPSSDLDVGLRDGTGGAEYLAVLRERIPAILDSIKPELIVYVGGADPYMRDQLGALKLTIQDLMTRDFLIYSMARERNIPVSLLLAGGYAYDTMDTVIIHSNSVRVFLGKAAIDEKKA